MAQSSDVHPDAAVVDFINKFFWEMKQCGAETSNHLAKDNEAIVAAAGESSCTILSL
jgi:hypothetical protein